MTEVPKISYMAWIVTCFNRISRAFVFKSLIHDAPTRCFNGAGNV